MLLWKISRKVLVSPQIEAVLSLTPPISASLWFFFSIWLSLFSFWDSAFLKENQVQVLATFKVKFCLPKSLS